jgi:hypothetical protein
MSQSRTFASLAGAASVTLAWFVACALPGYETGLGQRPDDDDESGAGRGGRGGNSNGGSSSSGAAGEADGGAGASGNTGGSGGSQGGSAGTSGATGGAGTGGDAGGPGETGGTGTTGGEGGTSTTGGEGGTGGSTSGGTGGMGPGCATAGFVLCDDFESGTDGWETSAGQWQVVADSTNVYEVTGSGNAFAGSSDWTDQIVESRMKIVAFSGATTAYRAGILARRETGTNFFSLVIDATGSLALRRGTSSVSGCPDIDVGVPLGTWVTLRLEVSGPPGSVHIRTFLDDTLRHDCMNATIPGTTSGPAGLVAAGSATVVHFDDFFVSIP